MPNRDSLRVLIAGLIRLAEGPFSQSGHDSLAEFLATAEIPACHDVIIAALEARRDSLGKGHTARSLLGSAIENVRAQKETAEAAAGAKAGDGEGPELGGHPDP